MSRFSLCSSLIAAGTIVVSTASANGNMSRRPNIILFMVDDLGWQDTSVPFWNQRTRLNNLYETPNMERLAQEGMLFTQAYASPISSPSRCSLLTGSNAARHHVTNWTFHRDTMTDGADDQLVPPKWNVNGISQVAGVPNTFVARSFVDILREHGYHTIHCGKAHWGAIDTPGEAPEHFGFEKNIAGHAAGGPATYLSERRYGYDENGRPTYEFAVPDLQQYWNTGTFLTEALTQEALKALNQAKRYQQPFYLYMSHYAVHVPIDRDERYYSKYRLKGMSEKEAAYASLIEGIDTSLGEILDWLDTNGERDNTIVIFMSDNGGFATSTDWRDEPLYTQNAPLKCGKGSLHEGGIREPMIVRWPGITAAGSRCNKYLIIEDFFPTILEMAHIRYRSVSQIVDGRSFTPLLKHTGDTSKGRALVWNYPHVWGNTGPGIDMNCAIRVDDWKLIYYYKTGRKELYNIETDISESYDLAAERPDITRRLSRRLGRELRKMKAQRPTRKDTGMPCPWPDEI